MFNNIYKLIVEDILQPVCLNRVNKVQHNHTIQEQYHFIYQHVNQKLSQIQVKIIPTKQLLQLMSAYVYLLINLRHLGSINRILIGMNQLTHIINYSQEMLQLPWKVVIQLVTHLKGGDFTEVLRRSAGIPYAFLYFLKCQYPKRILLIQYTLSILLAMASQQLQLIQTYYNNMIQQYKFLDTPILNNSTGRVQNEMNQLKIHSLNILKRLFQDSDLKNDLDSFVSKAFIISIKGFSSEDWNVRNSSLMLFSVLANRTVGIKRTFNLIEFFHKCPDLLRFIQQQLNKVGTHNSNHNENIIEQTAQRIAQRVEKVTQGRVSGQGKEQFKVEIQKRSNKLNRQGGQRMRQQQNRQLRRQQQNRQLRRQQQKDILTMYPPLYPIVLLLSRLLPFDIRERNRMTIKGSQMKQLRKQQLLQMMPLITSAGNNSNYMGRIMTSKAILPFIEKTGIIKYTIDKLNKIHLYNQMNVLHYQLLECNQLIEYYEQIWSRIEFRLKEIDKQQIKIIVEKSVDWRCGIVNAVYIKILGKLIKMAELENDQVIENVKRLCEDILQRTLYGVQYMRIGMIKNSIISFDLGDSVMRKQAIELMLYLDGFRERRRFVGYMVRMIEEDVKSLQRCDVEVMEIYLKDIRVNFRKIKENESVLLQQLRRFIMQLRLYKLNDEILIIIISIRVQMGIVLLEQQKNDLIKRQLSTQNYNLKIQILRIMNDNKIIYNLLLKYSNPEQSVQLRRYSLEYIRLIDKFIIQYRIIYIRLLEDQEYSIRKQCALIVSKCLNLPYYNENYLKTYILKECTLEDFKLLLQYNSDLKIKIKNNNYINNHRIFLFDQPNKYRCDIQTLITYIKQNPNGLSNQVSNILAEHISYKQNSNILNLYRNNIISRNQFTFYIIVGSMIIEKIRLGNISFTHGGYLKTLQKL